LTKTFLIFIICVNTSGWILFKKKNYNSDIHQAGACRVEKPVWTRRGRDKFFPLPDLKFWPSSPMPHHCPHSATPAPFKS